MQSELASHIGLTGKYFCRVCQVKGKDNANESDDELEASDNGDTEGASESDVSNNLEADIHDDNHGRIEQSAREL